MHRGSIAEEGIWCTRHVCQVQDIIFVVAECLKGFSQLNCCLTSSTGLKMSYLTYFKEFDKKLVYKEINRFQ